jgi:hypothetical protein
MTQHPSPTQAIERKLECGQERANGFPRGHCHQCNESERHIQNEAQQPAPYADPGNQVFESNERPRVRTEIVANAPDAAGKCDHNQKDMQYGQPDYAQQSPQHYPPSRLA